MAASKVLVEAMAKLVAAAFHHHRLEVIQQLVASRAAKNV